MVNFEIISKASVQLEALEEAKKSARESVEELNSLIEQATAIKENLIKSLSLDFDAEVDVVVSPKENVDNLKDKVETVVDVPEDIVESPITPVEEDNKPEPVAKPEKPAKKQSTVKKPASKENNVAVEPVDSPKKKKATVEDIDLWSDDDIDLFGDDNIDEIDF